MYLLLYLELHIFLIVPGMHIRYYTLKCTSSEHSWHWQQQYLDSNELLFNFLWSSLFTMLKTYFIALWKYACSCLFILLYLFAPFRFHDKYSSSFISFLHRLTNLFRSSTISPWVPTTRRARTATPAEGKTWSTLIIEYEKGGRGRHKGHDQHWSYIMKNEVGVVIKAMINTDHT